MSAPITGVDLTLFRRLVEQRLGLRTGEDRLADLDRLLRERITAAGSEGPGQYLALLSAAPGGTPELRALAERLTVHETFFFRSPDTFRVLARSALPERMAAQAGPRRLRILSVGCASGEEPYSVAILLREAFPTLAGWDVGITGMDVNPVVLEQARRGRYSAWSLRATSAELRRRYFREEGRWLQLSPDIRRQVAFEERNLAEDAAGWAGLNADVVFCRNVLMYFTPERATEAVRRLSQALLPGGYLFVGHAESLRGLSEDFRLLQDGDTFYYRKRGAPAGEEAEPFTPEQPWYDVIDRSTARIAHLAHSRGGEPARAPERRAESPPWAGVDASLALLGQERFQDALQALGEVPDGDLGGLLVRAVLLTHLGRLEEARATCRSILSREPGHAHAHHVLALCAEQWGEAETVQRHERAAIQSDPAFAMPHLHLGLTARREGDPDRARVELEAALRLLPREDDTRLVLFGGGFPRETWMGLARAALGEDAGGAA